MPAKAKTKPAKLATWNARVMQIMEQKIMTGAVLTKKDFLKSIGFPAENIRQIITGKQSFRLEHIHRLALRYNINLNWLFGLDNQITRKPPSDPLKQLQDAVTAVNAAYRKK